METSSQSSISISPEWEHVQEQLMLIKDNLGRVIVGQDVVVERMLVALLCKGHCLIEGVPGLAKTLLVSTLGQVLGLSFHRIQFTPDLMPSDILGSEILQDTPEGRRFVFAQGPLFANLVLADEINRTPPKTQSALLEAMQEKQVTVAGRTLKLSEPFVVFATQNPIEHEGTYPLPEAQLDRFFFNLTIGYPALSEEKEVVLRTVRRERTVPKEVVPRETLLHLQELVYEVPLPDHVLDSILAMVHATRPGGELADDFVSKYVAWGAGPRASQCLALAARALAMVRGQAAASLEEVRDLAGPVLRHRVLPSYHATGEGIDADAIVAHMVKQKLR